ncbi:prepilin-type N-terminal cleavage/methylation domain-containing protein [Pseudomonas aeruginosa]|nr:prepilin-type N-terminal cleavage/methylation domain-containing protein [Pseudomonas aeruginosa]
MRTRQKGFTLLEMVVVVVARREIWRGFAQ